jgi:hypothetical protein
MGGGGGAENSNFEMPDPVAEDRQRAAVLLLAEDDERQI